MIRLEYIEVRYSKQAPALSIDELTIEAGERVAIIGASGAGKSTLLRVIKGYVRPRSGKVEVMGVNLLSSNRRARRNVNKRIALIYQQFHLGVRMSVLQNVLCGRLGQTHRLRSIVGRFTDDDRRIAWGAICEVGLSDQVHRRVDTLSGGEQQRVAIARAIAQEPAVILADEPVSSLDPVRAEQVLDMIAEAQTHHETTLVMSLHQPEFAKRFAQRIIGLRNGRVVFDGASAELTSARLKELYHGDDPHQIAAPPGKSKPKSAAGA